MSILTNPFATQGTGGTVDIKDASITQKGIVRLSNAIDSTDETLASTPKAVSQVVERLEDYADDLFAQSSKIHYGSTPPEDVNMLWIPTKD